MYTARTVAHNTHTSQAAVRYFARKFHLTKIIIAGKETYVFTEKEYRLYRRYTKGTPHKKEKSKQLTFPFFDECTAPVKEQLLTAQQKKKEAALLEKLCTLLKAAGSSGMDKYAIQKVLKIDKDTLQTLLNKHSILPIAEDESVDNNLYWVGL